MGRVRASLTFAIPQAIVVYDTSPPCLQVTAWWPRGSREVSGQNGHKDHPECPHQPPLNGHLVLIGVHAGLAHLMEGTTDSQEEA